MNVNPVSGALAANTAPDPQKTLGQDAFLKLLITQLQHQDPTQPKNDTEFIAQMAQFSSLEKLTEISASIRAIERALLADSPSNAQASANAAARLASATAPLVPGNAFTGGND